MNTILHDNSSLYITIFIDHVLFYKFTLRKIVFRFKFYFTNDIYKCVFLVLGLCVSLDFSAVSPNSLVGRSVCKANIKYMQ